MEAGILFFHIVEVTMSKLNDIREALGMDANYFYPALVTIVLALVTSIKSLIDSLNNRRKDYLFELYRTQETDYFYVVMMIVEIFAFVIGLILITVIWEMLLSAVNCFEINISRSDLQPTFQFFLFFLSLIADLLFIKKILLRKMCVRKRIIGRKKEMWLLYSPIIIYNIWLFFIIYLPKCTIAKALVSLILSICEVKGLICFKETYIKYKYATLTIFLKDGNVVKCEDISKIKRKTATLIIEKEHSAVHVRYDEVSRIEYSGDQFIQCL